MDSFFKAGALLSGRAFFVWMTFFNYNFPYIPNNQYFSKKLFANP